MAELRRLADCIFCEILDRTAPCYRVDEDEHTLTFLDLFPTAPGHTLIITKHHYENIFEATPEAVAAVGAKSVEIAAAIKRALKPGGIGVFQLNGKAAGQTVFHYHMHLIPRNDGEELKIHSRVQGEPLALNNMAKTLRQQLAGSSNRSRSTCRPQG